MTDLISRIPANDWITGDDGFVVYWPVMSRGGFSAHMLRAIADELDRRNADWAAEVEAVAGRSPDSPPALPYGPHLAEMATPPKRRCS